MLSNIQVIEHFEAGLMAFKAEATIHDSNRLNVRVVADDGSAWRTGFFLSSIKDERRIREIVQEIVAQLEHKKVVADHQPSASG